MREKQVIELAKQKYDYVLGGYENMVLDGKMTTAEIPTAEELVNEVYHEMMEDSVIHTDSGLIQLKEDIRFLGTVRIIEIINEVVERDGSSMQVSVLQNKIEELKKEIEVSRRTAMAKLSDSDDDWYIVRTLKRIDVLVENAESEINYLLKLVKEIEEMIK